MRLIASIAALSLTCGCTSIPAAVHALQDQVDPKLQSAIGEARRLCKAEAGLDVLRGGFDIEGRGYAWFDLGAVPRLPEPADVMETLRAREAFSNARYVPLAQGARFVDLYVNGLVRNVVDRDSDVPTGMYRFRSAKRADRSPEYLGPVSGYAFDLPLVVEASERTESGLVRRERTLLLDEDGLLVAMQRNFVTTEAHSYSGGTRDCSNLSREGRARGGEYYLDIIDLVTDADDAR